MESTEAVADPVRRLGKLPPKFDRRAMQLASYIEKRKLPKVPLTHTLSRKTLAHFKTAGVMGNNTYGNCTFVGLAHSFQSWTVYGKKPWCPSDEQIIAAYLRHTNGRDEGAYLTDVLKVARHDGLAGNKIFAYVAVDPLNHDQVRTAHFLFGGLYFGAGLPRNAQDQKIWDLVPGNGSEPWSWGGHCMNVWDYDKKGLVVPTWGEMQRLTWAWWDRYVDECFAILEEDYVGDDRRSPQGFSLARLAADIKAL